MHEALVRFRETETVDALDEALATSFASKGIERFLLLRMSGADREGRRAAAIDSAGYSPEFVGAYVEKRRWNDDPAVQFLSNRIAPYCRSEIDGELTRAMKRFEALREANGLGDALILPVFGPRGCNGLTEVMSDRPCIETTIAWRYEIQAIAQMAHQRYCEITGIDGESVPRLSKREHEVLVWVARGKSNTSIAAILEISANTVDTHLRRIYEKLDVADRTSAAIRAISAGLITT